MPRDGYKVRLAGLLHFYDIQVLNQLYQPLIGPAASSLYITLWQDYETVSMNQQIFTHHHLMVCMQTQLPALLSERKKLEAVGLLKVFKADHEEEKEFIYELFPPLSPHAFFTDGLLNIYLFNRIGPADYRRLKERYLSSEDSSSDGSGYADVTAHFNEVFSSVHPSELVNNETEREELKWMDRAEGPGPKLKSAFDFSSFYQKLSEAIIPHELINQDVEKAIETLSFVYKLTPEEMCDIIQKTFLHAEEVTIDELRKQARTYYRFEFGEQYPALSERPMPVHLRTFEQIEPADDHEKQIKFFEQVSPFDVLQSHSHGSKPSSPDLKLVEQIMFDQKLNAGVMNVLISYVMFTQDQKLNKSYVEKLASHWARKKITTVSEAMVLAKTEHKKYQQWSQPQKRSKQTGYRKSNEKTDTLPKWMQQESGKQEEQQNEKESDQSQDAKWLEDYLKNL
jgi:replication initiation and membrane attachment protein